MVLHLGLETKIIQSKINSRIKIRYIHSKDLIFTFKDLLAACSVILNDSFTNSIILLQTLTKLFGFKN